MKVEAHIIINANKTAVWTAITNIRHFAEMTSSVKKIEILNETAKGLIGLKWRETRMYFGRPAAIDKWISDAIENKYYTCRAEMEGFIFLTSLTISENNGKTMLTSAHETRTKGFVAKMKTIPMFFFRGVLKKAILQDLKDIKTAIERNQGFS